MRYRLVCLAVLIRRPEWRDRRAAVPPGVQVVASLAELPTFVLGQV